MTELFQRWLTHFKTKHEQPKLELDLKGDEAFVFDCDQTLIHGDIGEACFRYVLENRWVISHDAWWAHLIEADFNNQDVKSWRQAYEREASPNTFSSDSSLSSSLSQELWEAYENLCSIDVNSAYIYAARIAYQRHPVELALMTEYALQNDKRVSFRPAIKALIRDIQNLAHVWVVSSSHISIVRVIAHHYQIPSQHIIGIDFELNQQQLYTDRVITPTPIGSQKIDAFMLLNQSQPILMAGDSVHDIPMMKYAKSAIFIDHHKSDRLTQQAEELKALVLNSESL